MRSTTLYPAITTAWSLAYQKENKIEQSCVINIDFVELKNQEKMISDLAIKNKILAFINLIENKIIILNTAFATTKLYHNLACTILEEIQRKIREIQTIKIHDEENKAVVSTIISIIQKPCEKLQRKINNSLINKDDKTAFELDKKIFVLPCHQKLIIENKESNDDLNNCLKKTYELVKKRNGKLCSSLFISYSWPTLRNLSDEYWLQSFLTYLRSHLRLTGIHAILDIVDNKAGGNIIKFMEQARSSDYILLLCTESLLNKHLNENGLKAVNIELNNILNKRRADAERELYRVFPFLLTGTHASSYPANYELYSTVRDWRGANYIDIIKGLLRQIYELHQDNEFDAIWNEFARKNPSISRTPSEDEVEKFKAKSPFSLPKSSQFWGILQKSILNQWHHNREMLDSLQKQALEARLYLYANPEPDALLKDCLELSNIKKLQADTSKIQLEIDTSVHANDFKILLDEQQLQLKLAFNIKKSLLCYKQRDYKTSKNILNETLELIPSTKFYFTSFDTKKLQISIYNLLAKISRCEGNYESAYQYYLNALKISPHDSILQSCMGALLNDRANYDKKSSDWHTTALKYHRTAYQKINEHPNDKKSIIAANLARGLQQLAESKQYIKLAGCKLENLLEEADQLLSDAVRWNKSNITAYLFRAIVRMAQSRLSEALSDINLVLEKQPNHPTALLRKASIFEHCNISLIATRCLRLAADSLNVRRIPESGPQCSYIKRRSKL